MHNFISSHATAAEEVLPGRLKGEVLRPSSSVLRPSTWSHPAA